MHRSLQRLSLGALLTAQLTAAALADDIVALEDANMSQHESTTNS